MLKKLLMSTALSAAVATAAFAQSPGTPSSSSLPAAQAQSSGKMNFVSSQKPDQWLGSKFKGTDVVGSDNQKIGDVSDILFDKSGKVEAFVISVGGFLGVGSKEIALAPSSSTWYLARTARPTSSSLPRRRSSSKTHRALRGMSRRGRRLPPAQPVGLAVA